MKYKEQINNRLESAIQKLDIVTRGMQSNTLTVSEVMQQLEATKRLLEAMTELMELE